MINNLPGQGTIINNLPGQGTMIHNLPGQGTKNHLGQGAVGSEGLSESPPPTRQEVQRRSRDD